MEYFKLAFSAGVAACTLATGIAAQEATRLDSRNLPSNYRIFTEETPPLENYVVIQRDDETLVRRFESCPDRVQVGGVQVDDRDDRLFAGAIEENTGIFDTTVIVNCR